MITINKNASNDVVATLSEKVTVMTIPIFMFSMTHQLSGDVKIFIANDISTAPGRYNEFTIIDQSIEDPYDGKMNFQEGYYDYIAYNMPLTSPQTLDPDDAIEIVEIGKAIVVGPAGTVDYFQPTYTKNLPTWKG